MKGLKETNFGQTTGQISQDWQCYLTLTRQKLQLEVHSLLLKLVSRTIQPLLYSMLWWDKIQENLQKEHYQRIFNWLLRGTLLKWKTSQNHLKQPKSISNDQNNQCKNIIESSKVFVVDFLMQVATRYSQFPGQHRLQVNTSNYVFSTKNDIRPAYWWLRMRSIHP